jgi:hypothetical protein
MKICQGVLTPTLVGAALFVLTAPAVHADIITSLTPGGITSDGTGGFNFTYQAVLSGQQDIDTSINPGFGTVYDFGPVKGTITATGLLASAFTFSTNLMNTPAMGTVPTDNPTLLNVRFTDTSTDIAANTSLGTFTVDSPLGPNTDLVSFDGQSTKDVPGIPGDDTPIGNIGMTAAPAGVPGPTVGAGLPGLIATCVGLLALSRLRRRREREDAFA